MYTNHKPKHTNDKINSLDMFYFFPLSTTFSFSCLAFYLFHFIWFYLYVVYLLWQLIVPRSKKKREENNN